VHFDKNGKEIINSFFILKLNQECPVSKCPTSLKGTNVEKLLPKPFRSILTLDQKLQLHVVGMNV
jgi:hypothetical protein